MFYILVTGVFLRIISTFPAATVWLAYVQFGQVHNLQMQNLSFTLVRAALSAKRLGNLDGVTQ